MAINLSRGDYISLGKAVAKFNRTINELKTEENKTYFPEQIEYSKAKEKIFSKSELDRYITNLRKFSLENAQKYLTKAGEEITVWEKDVLKQEKSIALRRLNKELKNVSQFDRTQQETLKANISNLKNFEKLTGEEFKRIKNRIHNIGAKDYQLRKAEVFRKNYYEALEGISHFNNYEKFKKRLDKFKNPLNFYNFIQKSETMKDLFVYYKGGEGLTIGAFATTEEAFDYALENDYNMKVE